MRRKIKIITILFIFFIIGTFILIINKDDCYLNVPNPEKLSNILLIDVIDKKGVWISIIDKPNDIKYLLSLIKDAEKVNKDSVADFPTKSNFIIVVFDFKSGGTSHRSIYIDNSKIYIDLPYDGVYELDEISWDKFNEIMKKEKKESIDIRLDDILKGNY